MSKLYISGKPGRSSRACGHPGCGTVLYRGYSTFDRGFCAAHAALAPSPPPVRARDVRVAVVPYPSTNSGAALSMPVSLPREPWLAPEVPA